MNENTITLSADDATAKALVDTIRKAVKGTGKYAAYVAAHDVTRENVKDHARALAAFAFPKEKPVQRVNGKRTDFGNAVQAAGFGLRTALGKDDEGDDDNKPVNLLTRAGIKAELADVVAAWHAANDNN